MDHLKESMLLWLPAHMLEDLETVKDVTTANGLVLDFCSQKISFEQVCDEFQTIKVDMDDYLNKFEYSLRQLDA